MGNLKTAEGYIRAAYNVLKVIEDPNDDEAWLYLELGMLLHDLEMLAAHSRGMFIIDTPLEIN